MISLCLIVKPTEKEAKLLDRCLDGIHEYFDDICITQAGDKPSKEVSKVIKKYDGKESFFKWVKDFSKARNFNFSQAKSKYIFWCDADDIIRGAEKFPDLVNKMEEEGIDCAVMNYLYDFTKDGKCTVKHLKTRLVRKDAVKWVGAVHEDFDSLRTIESYMCPDIEVLHITNEKRAVENAERNLEIAKNELKLKPKDPRGLWLMANAYWGIQELDKAVKFFQKFVKKSGSEEEIYLAYMNMTALTGKEDHALKAISYRPTYPNAYFKLAEMKYQERKYEHAIQFIEIGLQLPKPDLSIIVFNPRDYDYNPLMLLMDCHFRLGNYTKSIEVLKYLIKLFPNDETLKGKKELVKNEIDNIELVDKVLKEAEGLKGKELRKFLESQSEEVQSHPKFCHFKNSHFTKKKSSGKDIVYYCGYTSKVWNPDIAEKNGVGGSEEAVIHLSKRWVEAGYNVTVYNNCGVGKDYDGVHYRPYWEFNVKDKQDYMILWRHPRPCDWKINCPKIFIDLHDVIPKEEFTQDRLEKIDKVFVKTQAHRILFPNIPNDKIAIIPNGIDPSAFNEKIDKDKYRILNTSSPDRHLDATLDVFEKLIEEQPDKPWYLAWYYGWDVYDDVHADNEEMKEWRNKQSKRFDKLVEMGRAEGGYMINHREVAREYLMAGVFLYPTQFYEIHCISAVKAQLAGCKMVTSDFAALKETVNKEHPKVHTAGKKWLKENTFGDDQPDEYIKLILNKSFPVTKKWAEETYNWKLISNKWINEIQSN